MGLNLERINAIKAKLAQESAGELHAGAETLEVNKNIQTVPTQPIQTPETQQAQVNSALSSLQALTPKPFPGTVDAAPKESAGTVNYSEVASKLEELQGFFASAHPRMPGLLKEILSTLDQYPECVTVLQEEQIAIIVEGLEKIVGTELAAITVKSASSGKKSKTAVTAASLGF